VNREPGISCARMRVLIEPHLDGTLPERWRPRLELHLAGCADCRAEIDAARQLGVALHRLPALEFPEPRLEAVLAQARDEERRAAAPDAGSVWSRLRERLAEWFEPHATGRAWRAALAASAVAVAAIAVVVVMRQQGPARPSQAELVQAERDALMALAYVIRVTEGSSQDALAVVVADVVDGVSRVENVMGNVGVVVAEKTAQQLAGPLTDPARTMKRRPQPSGPEARVDTTQQEERQ